jgi:ethanolamine utilization protein EutJ
VDNIRLVGGSSAFMGMGAVVQEYTGIKTVVPQKPLFITPLGIAMFDRYETGESNGGLLWEMIFPCAVIVI